MAATLRSVVGAPDRPVHVRVGREALDRPVSWVAVSELEDPTPYLRGGELLLTTGIRLTDDRFDEYVGRLVAAGVAALGLGVGLTHPAMPPALVAAAEKHQLPLLEVPEPTPFIAISKAVSDVVAAEEYESVTHAVAVQRDLTRAALAPEGSAGVVARLAKELTAWVLLVDPQGRLQQAAPSAAGEVLPSVGHELDRLRSRGVHASAAFSDSDRSVVVQPLAAAGRLRGHLVVIRTDPFTAVDQAVIAVGVAVLSLSLERPAPHGDGAPALQRELSDAVFGLLLDGADPDRLPLATLGWDHTLAGPVRVLVTSSPPAAEAVAEHAVGSQGLVVAGLAGETVVVVGDDDAAEHEVLALAAELPWGVSGPVTVAALGDGLRQARLALAAAPPDGPRRFTDLARRGVAGLVDVEAGRGFADALLGPLESRDRGDLVVSVRAWLAHHGQWDAAAQSLGVHRHTLRYRMRRVEELLDRSLDDPDLRADLWVALSLRDRDTTA